MFSRLLAFITLFRSSIGDVLKVIGCFSAYYVSVLILSAHLSNHFIRFRSLLCGFNVDNVYLKTTHFSTH